ncbi:MAG: tetratricopeptide repeat protein [Armatimonadetes bacterium]|nr:tetratricopeptide repeat protein [Akkermansiaceae bacterium]
MKTLISLIVIALTCHSALAQSSKEAEGYYLTGMAAEKAGDPAAALEAYNLVLKLNPNHANAQYRLGQVRINAKTIRASATETKIGDVMIPVYQLEDATLAEAIAALSIAMEKVTAGKIAPNFVIEDPKNKLTDSRVSMQLKNVPVKAVLNYILTQTNARARYDEHAVVIMAR